MVFDLPFNFRALPGVLTGEKEASFDLSLRFAHDSDEIESGQP